MPIENIYSFLTYPRNHAKHDDKIEGVSIKLNDGKLCKMLNDVFEGVSSKRNVPIKFMADSQVNETRSGILGFFDSPKLSTALILAKNLQEATPGTAGMGLFFLSLGSDEGKPGKRLVMSRFAADEGVVANKKRGALSVEFVEQVFLKNAHTYKAATYRHEVGKTDVWKGIATDRQLNHGSKAIADYWIVSFLRSELTTTAAEGTRRLALAMRDAARSSKDAIVSSEIIAASKLAANLPSNAMTIEQFCEQFALSSQTLDAVKAAVKPPRLIGESFRFDSNEFTKHIQYKQVELDNQVTLSAPTATFDEVLRHKTDGEQHSFATRGKIVDQRLKASR